MIENADSVLGHYSVKQFSCFTVQFSSVQDNKVPFVASNYNLLSALQGIKAR